MINWKVRIRNKQFWVSIIPALAILVQAIAAVFGYTLNLDEMVGKILQVVSAVFAVLAILGIVVDPTTAGIGDSERAMSYEEPWLDAVQASGCLLRQKHWQALLERFCEQWHGLQRVGVIRSTLRQRLEDQWEIRHRTL